MNELVLANRAADWRRLKALVLDSVSSPITKRVYNLGLDEFFEWFSREPRPGFTKATVSAWRVALEDRALGAVSINVRITAVRKLAVEAAAASAATSDRRSPQPRSTAMARSRSPFRVLTSGAFRSACACRRDSQFPTRMPPDFTPLTRLMPLANSGASNPFQQRDGRWCIVDLLGKHGRVRTIPMTWVKVAIDAWTTAAGVTEGSVFRPVNRGDQVCGGRMSEKVVWQLLQPYAEAAGLAGIAPHDLSRARRCVAPPAANLNRSSCFWAMRRCRRPNGIWEPNRIWFTHRTTGSN
jgi:hypothetical protein